MISSTSPSEPPKQMPPRSLPRLSILLVLVATGAWIFAGIYSTQLNPEVRFWKEAISRKTEWVKKIHEEKGRVIGVIGGSTTTFGIDAAHLYSNYGLPVANLGLHAGMGAEFCVAFGLDQLQPDDVLIVSIEPALLHGDTAPTPLAVQIAHAIHKPELLSWRASSPSMLAGFSKLADLRPGGYNAFTMIGKLAMQRSLYRYTTDGTQPDGLQVTEERRPMPQGPATEIGSKDSKPSQPQISQDAIDLLKELSGAAQKKNIRLYYLLPMSYSPEATANSSRASNRDFEKLMTQFMPVLPDPDAGVSSTPSDFSDTPQHLTQASAQARAQKLAPLFQQLQNGRTERKRKAKS